MLWFSLSQISLLFLIIIGGLSFVKKTSWAQILAGLLSLLLILQVSSLYLSGGLIDYRFIEHANLRDISIGIGQFIPQFFLGIGLWGILTFVSYKMSRWLRQRPASKTYVLGLIVICFVLLSIKGGMLSSLFEVVELKSTQSQSFQQSLEKLGISAQDYLEQDKIEAQAGKNVIILSLESMERSLLHDNLAQLSPELRKLSKQYTFIPMAEMPGSDWTQGSLYTFLTGIPFFFGGNREKVFEQAEATLINSLPLIFNKAGYEQLYIMGKPEFSATDRLLEILGIEVLSEKDIPEEYPSSPWGLHDVDLFTELKKAALDFHKNNKPFALYASTISTHWPDGIYDGRMEALIEKEDQPLAFSIKALDYLIGNFMAYLEENGILENTVVYIFPDHKFMQT
ncbi:MAG: sulfatase-like hydrolase/transferase, partial [Bacteroidota bacterium]